MLDRAAEWISDHVIFTMASIAVHTIVFVAWVWTHGFGLDNGGFTIGTGVVSLEAIYITLLVGVAVAHQSRRNQKHYAEVAAMHTRMLHMNERMMEQQTEALDSILEAVGQ